MPSEMDGTRYMSFSPDGNIAATGHFDGSVKLWDAETFEPLETRKMRHLLEVHCVDFSPDGRVIASAGADGFIKLWDAATGKHIASMRD